MQSQKANEKQKTETKDEIRVPTGDGGDNSGLHVREAQRHRAELAHTADSSSPRFFELKMKKKLIPINVSLNSADTHCTYFALFVLNKENESNIKIVYRKSVVSLLPFVSRFLRSQ